MRYIEIQTSAGTFKLPESEKITITFPTTSGIFSVTGPMQLVFAAAAEAFRK